MATLAALYDRLAGKGDAQADVQAQWAVQARPGRGRDTRLRPFINDDVHFHVKRIDNSRVIRAVDPQTPRTCWRLIAGAGASALLLIGLLLPTGYGLLAGYKIEELKKQGRELKVRKAALELEEAKLLSPERLAELAAMQELTDPDPGRVVHLSEKTGAVEQRQPAKTAFIPPRR